MYYLCNLVRPAIQFNEAMRDRWSIENRAYYVRGTQFQEDICRIRRNPCIFVLPRSFAPNLMRFNGVENISQGLYDDALCLDRVLAL
ncbi:MAG: hypothetical protein J5I81_14605 [Nitrococcus mobilis]|nr:hypothetical protein [Nitrococcus mobilis]